MEPKITVREAASLLGISSGDVQSYITDNSLTSKRSGTTSFFGHETAKELFDSKSPSRVISFQIVKGGTGKTTIAGSFAVRASLYGLKVLCIDMDQQGNLTQGFGIDADEHPVMIDVLVEDYDIKDAIINVAPGIDLLCSRLENAMLDEAIQMLSVPLDEVYSRYLKDLKKEYDLIVIDCPPNLGHSVAAVTLAVDTVVSPVAMEGFGIAGLEATCLAIDELETKYNVDIDFKIVVNKYDKRSKICNRLYDNVSQDPIYKNFLVSSIVDSSQDFPNSILEGESIFDQIQITQAKKDIDAVCREVLSFNPTLKDNKYKRPKVKRNKVEKNDKKEKAVKKEKELLESV